MTRNLTESQKERILHPSTGFGARSDRASARVDLELNNQRLLDLLKREKRAYDDETGTYTVLVISPRLLMHDTCGTSGGSSGMKTSGLF